MIGRKVLQHKHMWRHGHAFAAIAPKPRYNARRLTEKVTQRLFLFRDSTYKPAAGRDVRGNSDVA
jgi:hypothetical protein